MAAFEFNLEVFSPGWYPCTFFKVYRFGLHGVIFGFELSNFLTTNTQFRLAAVMVSK